MNSVNFNDIFDILNNQTIKQQNHPFSPVEALILRGIFENKTYREIAQQEGYSTGYLTNVVAPELYQRLSKLLGHSINKKNCLQKLETYVKNQRIQKTQIDNLIVKVPEKKNLNKFFPYPNIAIPLDSPYYIERKQIEIQINEIVVNSGALIILKSPGKMGKTSLVLRVLEEKKKQGYRTIYLTLGLVDKAILTDLEKTLRWLCIRVSQKLDVEPQLSLYWDQDLGSKSSCTQYFENYLLSLIKVPLILAIDEVDQLFENHEVIEEVFSLFRVWQEKSQQLSIWSKIRLILVQSTETLVIKSFNLTPPKIGQEINLGRLEKEEVQSLIKLNQPHIKDVEKFEEIIDVLGLHPGLISLTLYHLICQNSTLEKILETAATDEGIYQHHLQHYFRILQRFPNLCATFKTLLTETNAVDLNPILSEPLKNLGLIKQTNKNILQVSSQLYRSYFLDCL